MEIPLFALHTVLFPGQGMGLRVFEDRYLRMMDDVLPDGRFGVVAIRFGREVGGAYDPYRVGVEVTPREHVLNDDGTYELDIRAERRIRLVRLVGEEPYPRWSAEPFPDAQAVDRAALARAAASAARFLEVAGIEGELRLPMEDPSLASFRLASLVPGLLPERQSLLEVPGADERLRRIAEAFRTEAGLLRAIRSRRDG